MLKIYAKTKMIEYFWGIAVVFFILCYVDPPA